MNSSLLPSPLVTALAVLLATAIFIIDTRLPGDAAGGVLFIGLVMMGWWFPHRHYIFLLAAISTFLILINHFYLMGPQDDHAHTGVSVSWVMEVNHGFAIFSIWALAFVQTLARRRSDQLASSRAETLKAMKVAEAANRAKSDFLSSMSHELRTPMNAIIGFSEMMVLSPTETLSDSQREYTGYILQSAHHLLNLINDVLELSKIESGVIEMDFVDLAINDSIDESIRLITDRAAGKNISIDFDQQQSGHFVVRADPVRLRQVLLNLLSNAVKYNHEGGSVSVRCRSGEAGHIRVQVIDTGSGIPEDQKAKVFQAFNRLGRESGPVEGTGIGLTITRDLIRRMGGNIGFDDNPGGGTVFWFELPKGDLDITA